MRESNRLSALKVAHLSKPGLYGDGRGLWLRVASGGTKAWVLRFMLRGRARQMGLGPVDLVSLAEARESAREARKLLLDGTDPVEHRRSARTQARLEAAYRRGDLLAKRSRLMQDWANYCASCSPLLEDRVVALRKSANA